MRILGIDPGVTGALALHVDGSLETAIDMPVYDTRTDPIGLTEILSNWMPDMVFVEHTQPMPKNGSIASYSLGLNSGIIFGVVASMSYPYVRVRPVDWKRKMGVLHKDKNAIRGIVRELYPRHAELFKRVKDHNRAEAVLISRFGVTASIHQANQETNESIDSNTVAGRP